MKNIARKIENYAFYHFLSSDLKPIINGLGAARLSSYNHRNQHSPAQILRKYEFNSKLSVEIFQLLSILEILLRNNIQKSWAIRLREDFPLSFSNYLNSYGYALGRSGSVLVKFNRRTGLHEPVESKQTGNIRAAIAEANKTSNRQTRATTSDDVVANLTFGFWRYCFDPHHQHLMNGQIRWIFPNHNMNKTDPNAVRLQVWSYLGKINLLRNRIAHHDKIFHMKEIRKEELFFILTLISWIDPKVVKFTNYKKISSLLDSGWTLKNEKFYDPFPQNTF